MLVHKQVAIVGRKAEESGVAKGLVARLRYELLEEVGVKLDVLIVCAEYWIVYNVDIGEGVSRVVLDREQLKLVTVVTLYHLEARSEEGVSGIPTYLVYGVVGVSLAHIDQTLVLVEPLGVVGAC